MCVCALRMSQKICVIMSQLTHSSYCCLVNVDILGIFDSLFLLVFFFCFSCKKQRTVNLPPLHRQSCNVDDGKNLSEIIITLKFIVVFHPCCHQSDRFFSPPDTLISFHFITLFCTKCFQHIYSFCMRRSAFARFCII